MGLKTVLGYDRTTSAKYMRDSTLSDPFKDWKDARSYFYDKRAPIYYALILLCSASCSRAPATANPTGPPRASARA